MIENLIVLGTVGIMGWVALRWGLRALRGQGGCRGGCGHSEGGCRGPGQHVEIQCRRQEVTGEEPSA